MVLQMPRPFKKPETGVYYFRRIVPEPLRKLVGKLRFAARSGQRTPRWQPEGSLKWQP